VTTIEMTTPDTTPRSRTDPVRAAVDVVLMVVLGAVFLRVAVWPTFVHHYPFAVGPDMPVYLWWSRVGAAEGISIVGERPGTPALIPTVATALGIGLVPAVAGVQYALMPACGLAAAALARGRGEPPRLAWLAGAVLAGAWTTFLGGGYLANLALVAAFLAAAAALARRTRRGTVAAALLLGGGGLAHPEFFVVAAAVLVATAVWSWRRSRRGVADGADAHDREDAGRVLAALGGGAGLVGAGIIATLIGPARLEGDTSLDAMLRRTGQWAELRRVYLDRLVENWRRYAPFMTTALAVAGSDRARGFVRRFLVAWALVTAVALPIGVITGWFPPDRLLTFAFCLPILAGFGLVWIGDRIGHRMGQRMGRPGFAWAIGVVLVTLIVLPAMRDWRAQQTYMSPDELTDVTYAGRIAATTPAGTSLVFVADDPDIDRALFRFSHGLNVVRAALPPERAADVSMFLGCAEDLLAGRPTQRGDAVYDLASADSLTSLPQGPRAVFVVRELDGDPGALTTPGLTSWEGRLATDVPIPDSLPIGDSELVPSSPATIAHATIRTLLLFLLLGGGWAWWAFGDRARDAAAALAVAPAFGSAILTLTSLGLERVGADLDRGGTASLACAVAGGLGYALLVGRLASKHRRRGTRELVLEEPAELDP
jgi:hypothetical protein